MCKKYTTVFLAENQRIEDMSSAWSGLGLGQMFRLKYDKCVHELLAEECSGHYRNFLQNVCKSVAQVTAEKFFAAMEGWGTDEDLLIELTLTRTNQEIRQTKDIYLKMFDRPVSPPALDRPHYSGHILPGLLTCANVSRDCRLSRSLKVVIHSYFLRLNPGPESDRSK